MNVVALHGRLGRDPEIRLTSSGKAVCTLRLATAEFNGGTEWHDVICWEKAAENCARFLKKGSGVAVVGRLQTRSWEDQQGQTRYRTEVVAHRVDFTDRREVVDSDRSGPRDGGYGQPARPAATGGFVDDDIPFSPVEW